MSSMASAMSTPKNTISKENLTVSIRNKIMNDSIEFSSDCDSSMMDTDSPTGKKNLQPISKKLFHSPITEQDSNREQIMEITSHKRRKAKKRKQTLLYSSDKIKGGYIMECDGDSYSPDVKGGMRKRVLISLFHNKEYSMDFS